LVVNDLTIDVYRVKLPSTTESVPSICQEHSTPGYKVTLSTAEKGAGGGTTRSQWIWSTMSVSDVSNVHSQPMLHV
jgi:hypothetical protein